MTGDDLIRNFRESHGIHAEAGKTPVFKDRLHRFAAVGIFKPFTVTDEVRPVVSTRAVIGNIRLADFNAVVLEDRLADGGPAPITLLLGLYRKVR